MRLLRGLIGALLWILAALLGLVGVILCVTLILLPLGIPLLAYARRLFTSAVRLMLPPAVAHPVKELDKTARKKGRKAKSTVPDVGAKTAEKGRKAQSTVSDVAGETAKKARKVARRPRKKLA